MDRDGGEARVAEAAEPVGVVGDELAAADSGWRAMRPGCSTHGIWYFPGSKQTAQRSDKGSELDSRLLSMQLTNFAVDDQARGTWEEGNRSLARGGDSPQWQRVFYNWALVENWALEYHPNHNWTAKLRDLDKGAIAPGGGTIPGLGCKFGSVTIIGAVITEVHKNFNLSSPCNSAILVEQLMGWRHVYRVEHHAGFDVFEDLPKLIDAALSVPHWSTLKRAQVAAMLIYSLDHGHRPDSECCPYCLNVNDISAPTYETVIDSHGCPKFFRVSYYYRKGWPPAEQGQRYGQQFHCNPYDARLCAVKHILGWLAAGGHAPRGPLFGNLAAQKDGGQMLQAHHKAPMVMGKTTYNVWHTVDGRPVNFTSRQVADMLKVVFEHANWLYPCNHEDAEHTGFSDSVPHDFRVAFAMWVRFYRRAESPTFE
ncbi:hypothetical protein M885DRAFT_572921 [Pelagophyceae sp. CCMP2097]|nr:hypothetical protein M885DRAFT_572921 [Pelagophyceae sp. CCMP2097]